MCDSGLSDCGSFGWELWDAFCAVAWRAMLQVLKVLSGSRQRKASRIKLKTRDPRRPGKYRTAAGVDAGADLGRPFWRALVTVCCDLTLEVLFKIKAQERSRLKASRPTEELELGLGSGSRVCMLQHPCSSSRPSLMSLPRHAPVKVPCWMPCSLSSLSAAALPLAGSEWIIGFGGGSRISLCDCVPV
ncbi:hypothetical protein BC834DRAFT_297154 [Gloeopeniophorella convolvens]|nr:hypothetical protein BC834DRAFT_297154 [Gloeopeniophorella convolvens]